MENSRAFSTEIYKFFTSLNSNLREKLLNWALKFLLKHFPEIAQKHKSH